jgi:protein-L-isoaspartate(D-aspartate) O-methyltransferase
LRGAGGSALAFLVVLPVLADGFERQRIALVREVEAMVEATADETGRSRLDPRVTGALARVPRHEFVPPRLVSQAYGNYPLPIGHGQTISQPYIVALMTDLLGADSRARVLEIGTGSGYQAAILAEVAGEVFSIEIVEPLAREAEARLARLGYRNIVTRVGDGYAGWPEQAPFDGILVTAAPDHVPAALVEQLKPGGRLVLPVGETGSTQSLLVIEKGVDGSLTRKTVLPVRFVPLLRER